MSDSNLHKWDYSGISQACFSDPKQESYKKSAEFLGDTVEDWGCGTGWAKKYYKNYKGIDGSLSREVTEVHDLSEYTSNADNILMRQVLELDINWRKILENVLKSFRRKFCLIIFTPLANKTHVGERDDAFSANGKKTGKFIDLIYFNKNDILDYFPQDKFIVKEEIIKTNQGYGSEWILYVERI